MADLATQEVGLNEDRTTEVMTVNIGPHHPATHGVLRLVVDLEGEIVRECRPVIGYVHTGIEKSCEDKSYWKVIPFVERMDYVSYFFQMEAYCGAVERLVGLEIPPRARYLRTLFLELNRIHSHLVWLGTTALDLGAISMLWYCFRERDKILDLFEMATGQRMHTRYFQVGGVIEDIPVGFEEKLREFIADDRKYVLPPRSELSTSMESLIHHFKLVTEGFRVDPGEVYYGIESPRGELGCFVLADGSSKPARVHFRDPSFVNLQSFRDMAVDTYVADMICSLGMLDPILGGVDR